MKLHQGPSAVMSGIALALLLAVPAFAQSGVVDTNASGEGDIVVTATRQTSLLSKTPIAMSAVSGDMLLTAGITNPTALSEQVPNLSIDRNNGLQITIRGVTSTDNTEKGDPSAAFLLDGVYIARPQAQEVSFFDIDRVEVLRGPQGTLYGRNTTAGVVNVITKRPKIGMFEGSVDATYGNYDAIQSTATLNIPVGDTIAVRAAANYDRRDSYLKPGTSPYSLDRFKDNLSGRLSVLAELGNRGSLLLRSDYSRQKGSTTNGVLMSNFYALPFARPTPGTAGLDPVYTGTSRSAGELQTLGYNEPVQSFRDNESWGIHGELEYGLTDELSLNYLGSYREFTRHEGNGVFFGSVFAPGSGLVANLFFPLTFDGKYAQNSQELRLAFANDSLKVQSGGYYFREKSNIEQLIFGFRGAPGQRGYVFGVSQDPTISRSVGIFGQATYSLTDIFRLTGGVRYTKDDKSRQGAAVYHASANDPIDYTAGTQPGATNPGNFRDTRNDASVGSSKVTWRLGLDYDVNARSLLYATISTGYKAGGFNDGCVTASAQCTAPRPADEVYYSPETLTAYEVGFKTRFAGNAIRLNLSAFHYDYKNLQLTQFAQSNGAPAQRTTNAGSAKIDGMEIEATVTPAAHHNFNISANYLNARYTDYAIFPAQTIAGVAYPEVQFAGRDLDRSPRWTVAAGYNWAIPAGDGNVTVGVRTLLTSQYALLSTAMRAQFRQPGFTRTDLSATYSAADSAWYVQLFAKNVENSITVSSFALAPGFDFGFQNGTAQLGDPRTYGIRAGVKF